MISFVDYKPNRESYWRAIILFGNNVASYKFALAKSLLELTSDDKVIVRLEELAVPFSKNICEHLKIADRQGTSPSSAFLDECRKFNEGETTQDMLINVTVQKGFTNVLDAFHVVNRAPVPEKFFDVTKNPGEKSITITDTLYKIKETMQYDNLSHEAESRWRLVETAWSINISPKLLQVHHDVYEEYLFVIGDNSNRIGITSSREALNGYQKGKCFYCFKDITIDSLSPNLADVDHFFPLTLAQFDNNTYYNGVWNLVLACKECNRGLYGKMAFVPNIKYLKRLHKRNNFLIDSHHPLRETLIKQTGITEQNRIAFLNEIYKKAVSILIHKWESKHELERVF